MLAIWEGVWHEPKLAPLRAFTLNSDVQRNARNLFVIDSLIVVTLEWYFVVKVIVRGGLMTQHNLSAVLFNAALVCPFARFKLPLNVDL